MDGWMGEQKDIQIHEQRMITRTQGGGESNSTHFRLKFLQKFEIQTNEKKKKILMKYGIGMKQKRAVGQNANKETKKQSPFTEM